MGAAPMAQKASVSLSVERNVAVPMRDGTILYADVYRPSGPGPFPALLTRSPYDKAVTGVAPFTVRAATAGYAVVIQDVRGRFESEGEFYPFINERQDGFDTLEWLVGQPWCDGNVGMFGGSYVGMTQWQAALERPSCSEGDRPGRHGRELPRRLGVSGRRVRAAIQPLLDTIGSFHQHRTRANNGDVSSPAFQAIIDATDDMTA